MPRRTSGGRPSSVVNPKILHRRIDSCKSKYRTMGEIVDHLRSSYPEYSRIKQQPLTKLVRKALESMSPSSSNKRKKRRQGPIFQDDGDEEEFNQVNMSRKKLKKADKSEELEGSYIRRNRYANSQYSSSTDSIDSAEEDEEIDGDGEDGIVSTSEDGVYEQKVKPEIDLMKSMLMDRYTKLTPKKKAKAAQEENLEVDVNSDKSKQKIGEKAEGGKGLPSAPSRKGPSFNDFGGMKEVIKQLKRRVIRPLFYPQVPRELGVKAIRGILFHGPPGCGKTRLAHAIANETDLPFYKISATEVVSGVSGASEENIRELFSKAYRTAPSIIFIDEIDAIASKRENLQREMERRIVTQLLTCMDESHAPANSSSSGSSDTEVGLVLVIGATNRPDALDSALRKPGRFELEICLDIPDENARLEILSAVTRNHKLEGSFDLRKIAKSTPGFVGADLTALANNAGIIAMDRAFKDEDDENDGGKEPFLPEDLTKLSITMADYEEALSSIQPTLKREGFSAIPNVKWEDVGGLDSLRKLFNQCIVRRIKYPEQYENYDFESGFLLFGPPGCGKTLIAKAVANEAGANFIHIKGPELLSKYVGESEKAVRTLFNRARTCSPCIIFFDEMDSLTNQRGSEGGCVVDRVLNQLLIELDGGNERRGVFVIGATNRIDVVDKALLRPGRFGKFYVSLPSAEERSLILKAISRNKPIDSDVDLDSFARMEACEGLSGADLNALMNKAGIAAIMDDASSDNTVKLAHFQEALANISPSVSKRDIEVFDRLAEQFEAK